MTDEHWFQAAICTALYKTGVCEYPHFPECKDCTAKGGPVDIIVKELLSLGVSRPKSRDGSGIHG